MCAFGLFSDDPVCSSRTRQGTGTSLLPAKAPDDDVDLFRLTDEGLRIMAQMAAASGGIRKILYQSADEFTDLNSGNKGHVALAEDGNGNIVVYLNESKLLDETYHVQKSVLNNNRNIIASLSNNEKGVFGEIATDVFLTEKKYEAVHTRKTTLTEGWGTQGVDGIFKKDDKYFIVEAKYKGTAKLGMTKDGLQMSDSWIQAGRLENAVNNKALAAQMSMTDIEESWRKLLLMEVLFLKN